MKVAMPVPEKNRQGIFRRPADVALIREDDEVGVVIPIDVINGKLPGFGSGRERRAGGIP